MWLEMRTSVSRLLPGQARTLNLRGSSETTYEAQDSSQLYDSAITLSSTYLLLDCVAL
jgi:hypothetical protein